MTSQPNDIADHEAVDADDAAPLDLNLRSRITQFIDDANRPDPSPVPELANLARRRGLLTRDPSEPRKTDDPRYAPTVQPEPEIPPSQHGHDDPTLTHSIIVARNAGHTQAEIADALHIHVQTVRRHLAKAGVPTRRASLTDDQLDEARRFCDAGWTLRQLSLRYCVAHTTTKRLLANSEGDTL